MKDCTASRQSKPPQEGRPTPATASEVTWGNAVPTQDAKESEEPDTPAPRLEGRLSNADYTKLTIKLHTVISPHHISSLGFGFEGSFPSNGPNSKDGYEHKSASIAFTKDNLISESFYI